MTTKKVIQQVLIGEVGQIIEKRYYYLSFIPLAIGIEFLGKCLRDDQDWHHYQPGSSRANFKKALEELMPKYKSLDDKYDLYDKLRNGFAHAFISKPGIILSNRELAQKEGYKHLDEVNGDLALVSEDLYEDFKKACEKVILTKFGSDNKVEKRFF